MKITHPLCESPSDNPLSRGDFLYHPAERDAHVSPLERGLRGVFLKLRPLPSGGWI